MNESSYITLLGKLEHSDSWGFGDAFWLISDYAKHLGQAFNHDQAQWNKTYGSICDIWTTRAPGVTLSKGKTATHLNDYLLSEFQSVPENNVFLETKETSCK